MAKTGDFPMPPDPTATAPSKAKKPKGEKLDLPLAPPKAEEKKRPPPKRYPYDVVMKAGGNRYGPYSPKEGAVDNSEAIQRVLDENPSLKPHLAKARWEVERTSETPISGNSG